MNSKHRSRGPVVFAVALTAAVFASATSCDRVPLGSDDPPAGPIVLQAPNVHVLGSSDSIAAVEDLDVLEDGSVWVLNSVEPFFVGFDPGGRVVHAHGRRGGGPDEFGAPSGFVAGGIRGSPWVYDRERHLLVEVGRPGEARSEIRLPQDEILPGTVEGGIAWGLAQGSPVRFARAGERVILPRRSSPPEAGVLSYWLSVWSSDLVAFEPDAGLSRTVVSLAERLGDPMEHFELTGSILPFPLWYRLWAVCSGEEIRVHDRLRNELRGFTLDGTELDPVELPPPPEGGVTHAEFARATFDVAVVEALGAVGPGSPEPSASDSARILDGILARLDADADRLGDLLPRYLDFRCDEAGTQWLQPFDLETGALAGGSTWLRITPEGERREVRFPARFDPYRFTPERIWGVQRDEFDVPSVAWIATPGAG